MAKLVQAVTRYGPRLTPNRTATPDEAVAWLAAHLGVKRGMVLAVLLDLPAAVSHFNRAGTAVKLSGLGIFSPSIRLDGEIHVCFRADRALKRELNTAHYRGEMRNRKSIGLDAAALKARWDAEFPDDPLEADERRA